MYYGYSFVLPTPFDAVAGTKYWVRVEASQTTYPDWGIAVGGAGNGQHYQFSLGAGMFSFAPNDAAFMLLAASIPAGDTNCDGLVDFDDISPFVTALIGRSPYETRYPLCSWLNGDVDANGDVDFDDITPFVRCLVSGGCP